MASKKYLLTCLLFLSMIFSIHSSEDLDLERQLQRLRKPAVKTIKTWAGDTYDCVNIREQPSLDHPALKNYKIQMPPKGKYSGRASLATRLLTVDCPKGTVPIRRISREDLIRAKIFTESFLNPLAEQAPSEHFAILRSKPNFNQTIIGVQATMSIHAPGTVEPFQSSSARMWLGRGDSSVQTGWMVSPKLYGDTNTRLFTFWKTKDNGCFNLVCGSGFVQVDQHVAVDSIFNKTSTPQTQYEIPIRIEKNERTSCWWLVTNGDVYIGYWMSGTLPDLDNNGANYIAWGGMTTTSPPPALSPPMGSGTYGVYDFQESAYWCQLEIVDSSSKTWLNPHEADLEVYYDKKICYDSAYDGYQGKNGHVVFYGGPGGKC